MSRRRIDPEVVIIGAGIAGIAAGVRCRQAGIDSVTIYEMADGIGGTWWHNTYPGAEVDVPSAVYSYAFRPNDWSRTHARQVEVRAYLEATVDELGLRPHVQLGVEVHEASWDEDASQWTVHLGNGRTHRCHVLISAVGFLSHPKLPTWPGLEQFPGPALHTALWDHDVDLTDRRVAVVGTGSSAVQVVPEIAEVAREVLVFQREPSWILPKASRDLTDDERARLRRPLRRTLRRWHQLWLLERNILQGGWLPDTRANRAREAVARAHIAEQLDGRPDLVDAVTPRYAFPGKRPVFTSAFYPALTRDDVRLVPHAVAEVQQSSLVDTTGTSWPVDVLVFATGFDAANYLPRMKVFGRSGRELHDAWAGEPSAFLGLTVPGYPNLYMLYGPNTNGLEIVSNIVRQAEYAVRAAKRIRSGRATSIEVDERAHRLYNRWLQRALSRTSWVDANNYFKSESGRIVTQWPYGAALYALLTKVLFPLAERSR